ncbi:MAG TPA: fumarylacetoacetate hydrolase family protein [Aestuariivirgaceae bacterium]|jgi:2-keto-4-pentenoate hydratase/2-oxohepta-3-ene-1,7-dioic acid hydratase in catechol pathway|nr:fumarylacetoacetate hydrolase family protein [Aestuariivirgaceae bacterium]
MRLLRLMAMLLLAALAAAGPAHAQATLGDDAPLRFGRFEAEGQARYGVLSVGGVHELDRSFLDPAARVTGRVFPLEGLKLLPPVVPSKIIGIALNYPDNPPLPDKAGPGPGYFAKLPSALIGDGGEIVPPADSTNLNYEGEMVVVIGKQARKVSQKEALDYVFGVTAGNDVTERGYPFSPLQVLRAKGSDSFAPLGPWIVPGLLYDDLRLTTRLNGEVVQSARTSRMIKKVAAIVSDLSQQFTLEPGDLIFTGTPGKTRAMKPGDMIEVELDGVGVLRSQVAKGSQ